MASVDGCTKFSLENSHLVVSKVTSENRFYKLLQELHSFYCSQFGSEPEFFVRVPGRVNIIGEHVDYCGYPVLPMAIDQCIFLAVGATDEDSLLLLRNKNNERFKNFQCDLSTFRIELPEKGSPEWYKYYLCGVKGIFEQLKESKQIHYKGMRIALHGNIPPAAGLSSSSALVSAAVLATAHIYNLPLERKRLASISASSEHYIGTEGGGMDQAIAYLAKAGYAQFIEFEPNLVATPIQLPAGACFVVANSLAEANKAAFSDFNERVMECRIGCRILAKRMNLKKWREMTHFASLQKELQCNLMELEDLVLKYLTQEVYTREKICSEFDMSEQELEMQFLTPNTRNISSFKLKQRALHVLQESKRVQKFRAVCDEEIFDDDHKNVNSLNHGKNSIASVKRVIILSELMRQSHNSLKHLYECSHPDLDHLVEISDETQGVGARLTGAGWGGCIVAICDSVENSAKYMRELKDKYFSKLPIHILERHRLNDFSDVVFATSPGDGAEIFTP